MEMEVNNIMGDFDEEIEADTVEKKKDQRWDEGYLPPAKRGPEWYCDCVVGNPRPGVINGDYTTHNYDCLLRKRLASKKYMNKVHGIYGTPINY